MKNYNRILMYKKIYLLHVSGLSVRAIAKHLGQESTTIKYILSVYNPKDTMTYKQLTMRKRWAWLLYKERISYKEIASTLMLSETAVIELITQHPSAQRLHEMIQLRTQGKTLEDIGKVYDITRQGVHYMLRGYMKDI